MTADRNKTAYASINEGGSVLMFLFNTRNGKKKNLFIYGMCQSAIRTKLMKETQPREFWKLLRVPSCVFSKLSPAIFFSVWIPYRTICTGQGSNYDSRQNKPLAGSSTMYVCPSQWQIGVRECLSPTIKWYSL